MSTSTPPTAMAARAAFAGSALFAALALIITFSSAGAGQPFSPTLLFRGILGASSHLVLLPVVAELPASAWARAGGYAWIAIDTMLNVASINGADPSLVAAFRLGGHVPAGLWMADAARRATGPVRAVGLPPAATLMIHAFASPWIPAWVLFIPLILIPVWLALVGRSLQHTSPVMGAASVV